MRDLWPKDLAQVQTKAPVSILKEQATLLAEKTDYAVGAEVQRIEGELWWITTGDFAYSFYITAPRLGGYKYRLFAISHGVEMYPVKIDCESDVKEEILKGGPPAPLEARTEEDYVDLLSKILNSRKARQVVQAILAQSK